MKLALPSHPRPRCLGWSWHLLHADFVNFHVAANFRPSLAVRLFGTGYRIASPAKNILKIAIVVEAPNDSRHWVLAAILCVLIHFFPSSESGGAAASRIRFDANWFSVFANKRVRFLSFSDNRSHRASILSMKASSESLPASVFAI